MTVCNPYKQINLLLYRQGKNRPKVATEQLQHNAWNFTEATAAEINHNLVWRFMEVSSVYRFCYKPNLIAYNPVWCSRPSIVFLCFGWDLLPRVNLQSRGFAYTWHTLHANYFKDALSGSALGYEKCFVSKGYHNILACERQTFLLARRRWGTFREEECLRLIDRNSILMTQNLPWIRSEALIGRRNNFIVLAIVYKWQTKNNIKATKVKCKRDESLTKQPIFVECSLL